MLILNLEIWGGVAIEIGTIIRSGDNKARAPIDTYISNTRLRMY